MMNQALRGARVIPGPTGIGGKAELIAAKAGKQRAKERGATNLPRGVTFPRPAKPSPLGDFLTSPDSKLPGQLDPVVLAIGAGLLLVVIVGAVVASRS